MGLKKMTEGEFIDALFARVKCLVECAAIGAESVGTPLELFQDELARRLESLRAENASLKAENAVMREWIAAKLAYEKYGIHEAVPLEVFQRVKAAEEAYRTMEEK